MSLIVHYGGGEEFELTETEFKTFSNAVQEGKNVFIPRLKVLLSKNFIWAGEKPKSALTKGFLHDGTYVEKRFGKWIDPKAPDAIFDYSYYPELAKDEVLENNPKLLK